MLPELPHDVIVDILSRLPCKSLVKFRCVSKQWNSLIRSHKFAKLQFSRSTGDTTSRLRLLLCLNPVCSVNYDDLDDFFETRPEVIHEEDAPPLLDVGNVNYGHIIGECNGLICIMLKKPYRRSFLLWNPTTRECKEVRKNDVANLVDVRCMFDIKSDCKYKVDVYGFGYDSSSDDYKISRLMMVGANPCTKVVHLEIYRVGSQTWRKIEHPVFFGMTCIFHNTVPLKPYNWAFLNGAGYWVMSKFPTKDNVILRFDLGKEEEVKEITLPPYLSNSEFLCDVIVIDGKLALPIKINNAEIEIWIMNEYGAGSLFTKKMTVRRSPWCTLMSSTLPICFPKNGGVLMYDDSCRLSMRDPEKSWNVTTGFWRRHHLKVYAESLISPYHIPNTDLSLGEIA
ncbi:unnamed protein product [Rhodiola kirilowii]